jgi:hypothetical protein
VDEQAERFMADEEPQADLNEQEQEEERTLSQRELVRASLLRCPPGSAADPPRR